MEQWERKKTIEKRMNEIKNTIDLERGVAMSPSRKRPQEENMEDRRGKKSKKLKYPVMGED